MNCLENLCLLWLTRLGPNQFCKARMGLKLEFHRRTKAQARPELEKISSMGLERKFKVRLLLHVWYCPWARPAQYFKAWKGSKLDRSSGPNSTPTYPICISPHFQQKFAQFLNHSKLVGDFKSSNWSPNLRLLLGHSWPSKTNWPWL